MGAYRTRADTFDVVWGTRLHDTIRGTETSCVVVHVIFTECATLYLMLVESPIERIWPLAYACEEPGARTAINPEGVFTL